MKIMKKTAAFAAVALLVLLFGLANGKTKAAKNTNANSQAAIVGKKSKRNKNEVSFKPVVKIAGKKNYAVYKRIVKGRPRSRIGQTNYGWRKNHLESDGYVKTKRGRYWRLYVDGRKTGYISESYFARNVISVARRVSLVQNDYYRFPVRYAVNYVTNRFGSVVSPKLSRQYISTKKPGKYKVKVSSGKHCKKVTIIVRKSRSEGVVSDQHRHKGRGTNAYQAPKHHTGHSDNYRDWTDYSAEKSLHELSNNGLTLKTVFYQPIYLSLHARQQDNDDWDNSQTTVGHILEGMTVSGHWLYASYLCHENDMQGHVVGYDLGKLNSPFHAQDLLTMPYKKFCTYIKYVEVSPFIVTGHCQSLGSTKRYVYLMANDHLLHGAPDSELIVQLNKNDLTVRSIWSFKIWKQGPDDPRYAQNGCMIDDQDMLVLVNKGRCYEWWQLNKHGNSWQPQLAAVTRGKFVNNHSPVQGIAYDKQRNEYYISFNDLICRVKGDGSFEKAYQFQTGRETEGISVANNRLYVNLAQRPELMVSEEKLSDF